MEDGHLTRAWRIEQRRGEPPGVGGLRQARPRRIRTACAAAVRPLSLPSNTSREWARHEEGHEVVGQLVDVRVGRQLAVRDRGLEVLAEAADPARLERHDAVADDAPLERQVAGRRVEEAATREHAPPEVVEMRVGEGDRAVDARARARELS